MGRRVLTMDAGTIRRATVFVLLFGGAIGLLAWAAGGRLRTSSEAADESPAVEAVPPGPDARVARNLSVGETSGGLLSHDAVKVIDSKPCRYRAWTAEWAKSAPRKSTDPEVGVQDLVSPRIVLHPEPSSAKSAQFPEGAPGSTRITSKSGVLQHQKDVRTSVRLTGDVLLQRFDPEGGDIELRTETLDCSMESHGSADRRTAQTADHVKIDGARAHIEGDGLDADLAGDDCRVTILRNVKGRFDAAPGSLTATGGSPGSKLVATDVVCSGACELVSVDPKARGASTRWRATFHEEVRVTQGAHALLCDLLEIEFRTGGPDVKGQIPADSIVATGNVRAHGRTESGDTFDIAAAKATRTLTGSVGNEADVIVFEGTPVMNVHGPLRTARTPGQATAPKGPASKGRLEVRCDGDATMTTRRAGTAAATRTNVVFDKNVVAKQWDDETLEAPTGELRAPRATLYGTRLPGGDFQPDTLTAEGGVDLVRQDFTSRSETAAWSPVTDLGIDRYLLAGNPKVVYSGVRPLPTFGRPRAARDSRLVLESADSVKIDVYDDRPPASGAPPRPSATLAAGPRVVLVQTADGEEVSRATADQLDATIAQGGRLEQVRASGGAHIWGTGPDGQQRDVYGTRIVLDELTLPAGAPKDAPRHAQVTALGDESAPAVAIVREKDGARHDVRGETLRWDEDGSLITATGNVIANVSVQGRGTAPESRAPKIVDGAVKITAAEARVELAEAGTGGGAPQLRKVVATGGVLVDGKLHRVSGRDLTFDGVTGIAEVTGQPARLVSTVESERYTSFVNAELIRAYFDVSGDASRKGDLLRATCPKGGTIVRYFDPPGPDGTPAPGSIPRRMQVVSDGPIEVTRSEATAVTNVRADMFSLAPSGDWTVAGGTMYCERVRMTFDPAATGSSRDRLRTLEATGGGGRQVVLDHPDFRGRADRVEMDCATNKLRLLTTSENSVYVHETASGRQVLYDAATFDYVTHEWSDVDRVRVIEGGK